MWYLIEIAMTVSSTPTQLALGSTSGSEGDGHGCKLVYSSVCLIWACFVFIVELHRPAMPEGVGVHFHWGDPSFEPTQSHSFGPPPVSPPVARIPGIRGP